MSDITLGGYDQGIGGNPSTAVQTVEPGGLVDLSEAYAEDGMSVVDEVVTGLEQYKATGKLSGSLGKLLNLNLEPGVTVLNGVMGAEGLFTMIKDGFLKFIETAISYIVQAYQWVKARIRVLLGFDKTQKQIERCEKYRDEMQDELETLFRALKVPPDFDLAKLFEGRPAGLNRIETLTYVKGKLDTENESIERLGKAVPDILNIMNLLRNSSDKARKVNDGIRRTVDDVRRKLKADQLRGSDIMELNRQLGVAQIDTNDPKLVEAFNAMVQTVYGIEPAGTAIQVSLERIRDQIKNQQGVSKKVLTPADVRVVSATAVILSRMIVDAKGDSFDLGHFDKLDIDKWLAMEDAEMIDAIATKWGMPKVKEVYTTYAKNIKDYVSRLELTARTVNEVLKEAQLIIEWKNKADAMMGVYITQDMQKIQEAIKQLQANKGIEADFADADGKPHKFVAVKYVDGKSVSEVVGLIANKAEFSKIMPKAVAAVNNFSQQAGLNVKV